MKIYILVIALVFSVSAHAKIIKNIEPIKQYPMLCGTTVGEMILSAYDIHSVGQNNKYVISTSSKGSAVGQYICDLKNTNAIRNKQPKCLMNGTEIKIYNNGRPTSKKAAKAAYKKGTWLSSLEVVFNQYGLKTKIKRSVKKNNGIYSRKSVGNNFFGFINDLKNDKLVIFHVGYGKGVMGHYLLANGYDENKKTISYINPWPTSDYPAKAEVSYSEMKNGTSWFSKNRFWTGRYMSISK